MLSIQSYALPDPASAVEFLQQTMEGRERLFSQITAASREMRASRNPRRFLYVRFSLMEFMAAAYALKNRDTFDAAVGSLLSHPLPDESEWCRPTAAQLGGDLAVALSCRRSDRVQEISARIMRCEAGAAPEDFQSMVLALLAECDYGGAMAMLIRMRGAIATVNLPAHDVNLLSAWANAAENVSSRSDAALDAGLHEIMQQRNAYVGTMLARWRKGQNTDLTAIDFWDSQTTALMVIGAGIGLGKDLMPAEMPYADWRWTENARGRFGEPSDASPETICGLVLDGGRA